MDHMLSSANRKRFALHRLMKFGVQDHELVIIYTGYVHPVLEKAVPVWHSSLTTDQIKRLERVQKWVCKIILGQRYQGYCGALSLHGLCTLADRRVQLCLDFARKIYKSSFRDCLPPLREQLTGHQMRNSDKLTMQRCRTERYRRSPIPYMYRLLNNYGR